MGSYLHISSKTNQAKRWLIMDFWLNQRAALQAFLEINSVKIDQSIRN